MSKTEPQYKIRNRHGIVQIVGESELEVVRANGGEVIEKITAAVPAMPAAPTEPVKTEDKLECPICGTKGVGKNRFKTADDVKAHVEKKHTGV